MNCKKIQIGIIVIILGLITLSLSLTAAQADYSPIQPKNASSSSSTLKILTTTMIPYDIVKNVLGDLANVEVIVGGNVDIHTFQGPTSKQMVALSEADVLFSMGVSDLEPWLADTLAAFDFPPKVVELINPSMIRTDPVLDGRNNPHVWLDPRNMKIMANTVTTELSNLDSLNSANYQAHNMTYQTALDDLLEKIAGNLTLLQGIKCVTWHPAFTYLLDLLAIDQIATMEKVEGQEPSNAYISSVVSEMKQQDCKLIIRQPQIPAAQINDIAIKTGAKIDTLTDFPGITTSTGQNLDTYIKMMEYNLWAIQNPVDPSTDGNTVDSFPIQFFILTGILGIWGNIRSIMKRQRKMD